ncbi:MAG: type II secretion system F family protein, partial [Candidatus Micrarchaeota archaeon]
MRQSPLYRTTGDRRRRELIDDIVETFPNFGIFIEKDLKKTEEALTLAGMKTKPGNYLSFILFLATVISVIVLLLSLTMFSPESSVAITLFSFVASYIILLKLPSFISKRRARAMESDLPVALRSIATELNMGISFDRCMQHAANSQYMISSEFRIAVDDVEKGGSSTPLSLRGVSARTDSIIVKRAMQQLIESYKQGSGGQGIKHLADELVERQKATSREYNARISFLGLLFVVLSCIVPALFQAYAIVGSTFLYSSFSAGDLWFVYLVVFPLANATILLAIYERTPRLMKRRQEGIISRRQIFLANKALSSIGINIEFMDILKSSVLFSMIFSILLLLFSYDPLFSTLPFAIPALIYFFVIRAIENRTSELESHLPDALLQASTFPKGTPTEHIIQAISEANYGPLSEEFSLVSKQVSSGADVPSSLKSISEENDSILLSRVCELLSQAYSFGGDMHKAMKETAEDMFSIFSIVRERESLLALQKYTLLFGGGLIVPMVLGSIASAVSGLNISGIEVLSTTTPEERAALISASIGATQAYLVMYSLLASLFIA